MDFGVEHGAERFDNLGAHAAQAFGESVRAQKHHGAQFGFASGAPTPQHGSGRDSLADCDLFGEMRTEASLPKPVLMP